MNELIAFILLLLLNTIILVFIMYINSILCFILYICGLHLIICKYIIYNIIPDFDWRKLSYREDF